MIDCSGQAGRRAEAGVDGYGWKVKGERSEVMNGWMDDGLDGWFAGGKRLGSGGRSSAGLGPGALEP